MTQASEKKKRLREKFKAPSAISEEVSLQICAHIAARTEFHSARTIGIYAARPSEVSLRFLWDLKPDRCALPIVDKKTQTLTFYHLNTWKELRPGFRGILEPPCEKSLKIRWKEGDLVLVPGLLFDQFGGRLGSGLGYYDRFLAQLPSEVILWGVIPKSRILDEKLAQEITDVRMGGLVCESGMLGVSR